jgi:hypothetical protein
VSVYRAQTESEFESRRPRHINKLWPQDLGNNRNLLTDVERDSRMKKDMTVGIEKLSVWTWFYCGKVNAGFIERL